MDHGTAEQESDQAKRNYTNWFRLDVINKTRPKLLSSVKSKKEKVWWEKFVLLKHNQDYVSDNIQNVHIHEKRRIQYYLKESLNKK